MEAPFWPLTFFDLSLHPLLALVYGLDQDWSLIYSHILDDSMICLSSPLMIVVVGRHRWRLQLHNSSFQSHRNVDNFPEQNEMRTVHFGGNVRLVVEASLQGFTHFDIIKGFRESRKGPYYQDNNYCQGGRGSKELRHDVDVMQCRKQVMENHWREGRISFFYRVRSLKRNRNP